MAKKIILCLIFVFCGLSVVCAQKLSPSFRQDYLDKLYEECPDSLKETLSLWQTPFIRQTFATNKAAERLKKISELRKKDSSVLIFYETSDCYIDVSFSSRLNDFQFVFYYISPQDSLCNLCLYGTEGALEKSFQTKSGADYSFNHEWGFMELKKNKLGLLDCYLKLDGCFKDEAGYVLIPFLGTNTLVWRRNVQGNVAPAF